MAIVIRQGIKFKDSSICYKIYCLHFEQNVPEELIPGTLAISYTRVHETIKWINNKLTPTNTNQNVIIVDEASLPIQRTLIATPTNQLSQVVCIGNEVLKLCTLEENGHYYLFVKTNTKFENWMAANKQLKTTQHLWGENKPGEFYYGQMFTNKLDDINNTVILKNKINLAVLRVKGISNGLKIEINQLITQEQMKKAILAFKKDFKEFYNNVVKGFQAVDYTLRDSEQIQGNVVKICANCHKEFTALDEHVHLHCIDGGHNGTTN